MKVYEKVVIDIATGEITEEVSFQYNGLVCECKGGTTVVSPPPPPPSETEVAIQKEILAQMKRPPSELETKMQEYTIKAMQAQIEALPMEQEYREAALALMTKQLEQLSAEDTPEEKLYKELEMELTQWQLEGIRAAKEAGDISGDLSEDELTTLDQMESNAITNLQERVGRDSQQVMSKVVAEMVDRGVLQGDVGAKAISQVGERTQELLTEGIRDIGTTRMGQQLGLQENKANRELAWRQSLMSGAISQEQFGAGKQMDAVARAQQMYLGSQQMQSQAAQYGAGLTQDWNTAKLGAGIQQWGQMAGLRGATAQRALDANIASAQAKSAQSASMWGAAGSAAGMIGAAAIMSSKRYKRNIAYLGVDSIDGIPMVSFEYKAGLGMPSGRQYGFLAEDVVKVRPDAVVLDGRGRPDKINYAQLFGGK
ncbi:tail fiber domain-containing protein [Thermodesulfobacteriota bacterium]